jgi:hypothetical protein
VENNTDGLGVERKRKLPRWKFSKPGAIIMVQGFNLQLEDTRKNGRGIYLKTFKPVDSFLPYLSTLSF